MDKIVTIKLKGRITLDVSYDIDDVEALIYDLAAFVEDSL